MNSPDKRFVTPFLMLVLLCLSLGCTRERTSQKPPIHLNPDMDNQPRYEAQEKSKFFSDSSDMRQPVEGTVARGYLRRDSVFYMGKTPDGKYVEKAPVEITTQLLHHGEERFNIYCSPCHSRVGDGKGIMITRGYVPPPSFHIDRIRDMPDGEIFNVITYGIRNMPSYGHQVPPKDRWAIIAYLRALQRSHNAHREDIPEEIRETVQ